MASEEMDRALTRVKNAIKKLSAKGGVKLASEVWDVNEALAAYQGAVEEVLKRYEDVAQEAADEEALARRLNLVLRPLKEEMEEVMGVPLSLIPEESLLSYSDVSMILRTYLDVCEGYVRRFYKGNPPVLPELPPNWAASLIRDQILTFCRERPKSILEIGAFLGYKDKKTTRKYLNPLLTEGLLARTVPDKPNSRNQRYLTARTV